MKSNLIKALVVAILIACAVHTMLRDRAEQVENKISSLHPRVQESIRKYAEMTSKLKVGDLVEVRNHDNLSSTRFLSVTEVRQGWIHLQGRYDAPETLLLQAGLKEGITETNKFYFSPIYQDAPNYIASANWFWIQ